MTLICQLLLKVVLEGNRMLSANSLQNQWQSLQVALGRVSGIVWVILVAYSI